MCYYCVCLCIWGQRIPLESVLCFYLYAGPMIQLKLSGLHSKHFHLLSHHTLTTRSCVTTSGGSVVKSNFCSCRGPRFNLQQPHSISQPSITRGPEDSESSFDILGPSMHTVHIYTHRQNTHTHKTKFKFWCGLSGFFTTASSSFVFTVICLFCGSGTQNYRDQKTTFRSQFSFSSLWVPGVSFGEKNHYPTNHLADLKSGQI